MNHKGDPINLRKYQTIERMLDGEFVLVHLDPAANGVEIPRHLKDSNTVTLKLSRLFRGALEMEDSRINADLLFGSEYFSCRLPYEAIWGATSSEGKNSVWPESAPESVLKEIMKAGKKSGKDASASQNKKSAGSKRPLLRRVK